MNVAYLDPAYSRYFHELAGCLAQRTGGSSLALLSSPAYRHYVAGDRARVWKPGPATQLRRLPPEFEHASWAALNDPSAVAAFSHAVQWFVERFVEERIDVCLVFSDARPFSVAARLAAQEVGVVCLYFERGAFRLSSTSLSSQGLNARFSLRRAQTQSRIRGMSPEPMTRRPQEPWLRTRFARFVVANAVACLVEPNRRRIQHRRYPFTDYIRLAVLQWWTEHHHRRADPAEVAARGDRPLVVVALQLPSDSQLVLHSPFDDNQQFIDFVTGRVREVAPEALLLFKRHPMDVARYRLPEGTRIVGGNLARFDAAHPVVVCINSTVGFEAATRGLRVICLGPSFYTDAAPIAMATLGNFAAVFRAALGRQGDAAAGEALRAAVLRWYQAPGDAWAYTRDDIERTSEIVLQHYRAARVALAPPAAKPAPLRVVG